MKIYTDGACSPNPGLGGWATIFTKDNQVLYKKFGYEENTTNNRMELISVLKALELAKELSLVEVEIFSDSQYVINSINLNWKRNKNLDLWDKLDKLIPIFHNIQFNWIKGHDTNIFNGMCDELAVYARKNKINN